MSTLTCLSSAFALLISGTSAAAEPDAPAAPTAPTFEDLPDPTIELERLPPRFSWEVGLGLSYGAVDHWQDQFDAWVGFGVRTGWGRNVGNGRIGFDVHAVAEGPIGVYTTVGLEPHVSWDHVSDGNVLIGAGVGPAFLYHTSTGESLALKGDRAVSIEPSLVGRIGWSQTWTRVGRRMFVYLEPKLRPSVAPNEDDQLVVFPNPLLALVVGSGRGR